MFAPGNGNESGPSTSTFSSSSAQNSRQCHRFEFPEILLATLDFNELLVIGHGGFGKVYKGTLFHGSSTAVDVAIKRLDSMSNQGAPEFWAEVEMLSKLRHCHLVSLIGYCNHKEEMILVYEYMPHGTLADHLHKLGTTISWIQRLRISIGAARGLDYLHTGTVLCRKPAVVRILDDEALGLASWAQESIKEGNLKQIVDFDIRGEISPKCLKVFVGIAERCLHSNPKHRPTMAEVVFSLESVLSLQQKVNNSLPTVGKKIFGRMLDILPFTANGANSVMEFGFLTTKKKKQLVPRKTFEDRNVVLLLEDKLRVYGGDGVSVDSIKRFRAEELKEATDNYAEHRINKRGTYGSVYKGILADNCVVEIKMFHSNMPLDMEEFINEIVVLGQIQHRNVVRFLGFCLETEVPLVVHEFVSNGTLFDHLHNGTSGRLTLSWDSRLKIAHESAGALAYLHDARTSFIHGDVQSSNILLHENYTPKITNFGPLRLVLSDDDHDPSLVLGTLGYLDPEYHITTCVSHMSNVYSFGVVLAELLTRKRPLSLVSLGAYFVNAKRENRWRKILDSQVLEEATHEQLEAACDLVCRCLDFKGENRPSMKQVTMELKHIIDIGQTSLDSSRQLQ